MAGNPVDIHATVSTNDETLLPYTLEEQDWYRPLPATKVVPRTTVKDLRPDVVLLTAVDVEFRAVLRLMQPLRRQRAIYEVVIKNLTYYIGRYGSHTVALVQCEKGTAGRDSSLAITTEAVLTWNPLAVIAVGIAFGANAEKQKIADTIVSTIVHAYEPQRVGKETVQRGPSPEAGVILLDRFRNARRWKFLRPDGKPSKLMFGPLLSGEKLVDNPKFKKRLLKAYPDSIGGEMEATGVYAAASRAGVEWIIVKAICDWGEGKDKVHQPLAAAAAASLVHFVLSKPGVIEPLRNPPQEEDEKEVGSTGSKIFDVPYPRNNFFRGRGQELAEMAHLLSSRKRGSIALTQKQVLYGLGGIGKTQIAVEYAYRRVGDYSTVLWIRSDTRSNIIASITRSLKLFKLPDAELLKANEAIEAFKEWLETHADWLIIADNADEPALLSDVLPIKGKGHIILTSRTPVLDMLAINASIEVGKFDEAEAVNFFFDRIQRDKSTSFELTAVKALAYELDYFPLALEQAGAFIVTTGCAVQDYLTSFRRRKLELLEESPPIAGNYPASVATTWLINFQEVERSSRASAELLEFSAFLAPDKIPLELLQKGRHELTSSLRQALDDVLEDPVKLDQILEPLIRYSLIRRHTESQTYSIHRLVQLVIRTRLSVEKQRIYLERLIYCLEKAIPKSDELPYWDEWERILPQVQNMLTFRKEWGFNSRQTGQLLNLSANFCAERGRYDTADQLYMEAGEVFSRQHNSGTLEKARWLRDYAKFAYTRGELPKAVDLYEKCYEELEEAGEPARLRADVSLDIAEVYLLIDPALFNEHMVFLAIHEYEKELGEDDPDLALPLVRAANCFRRIGMNDYALKLARRAFSLAKDGRFEGDVLPAQILVEIAKIQRKMGDFESAEEELRKASDLFLQIGESSTADTTEALNEMAILYRSKKDFSNAIKFHAEAISMQERLYGADHPRLYNDLLKYAETLELAGEKAEAERNRVRAEKLYKAFAKWDSSVKKLWF